MYPQGSSLRFYLKRRRNRRRRRLVLRNFFLRSARSPSAFRPPVVWRLLLFSHPPSLLFLFHKNFFLFFFFSDARGLRRKRHATWWGRDITRTLPARTAHLIHSLSPQDQKQTSAFHQNVKEQRRFYLSYLTLIGFCLKM